MSGYAFHPDAFADLDEIWEYIAEDNIDAADRVLADIHAVFRTLAASPHIGQRRPDRSTLAIGVPRQITTCIRGPSRLGASGCG
jgi:plasmid stabilization system protein ParE